jgi:PhnB protein
MTTTITPYLSFKGTTREAYAFYEQALGAKILTMMRYSDMPKMEGQSQGCDGPPLVADDIMHACLELPGGAMLFAGDVPPHMTPSGGYDGIKGVMLALQYDTVDAAQSAFHALSQGAKVTMPLGPAFWAKTFGMLTDRFGVDWGISGEPIPMR